MDDLGSGIIACTHDPLTRTQSHATPNYKGGCEIPRSCVPKDWRT